MNIGVLISTMNLQDKKDYSNLLNNLNIKKNSVVINQCPNIKTNLKDIDNGSNQLYNFFEKGLSKSRNHAINKSQFDICVIADDDMRYVDGFEKIIFEAFNNFPNADIIAFYVSSDNPNNKKNKLKYGKINKLNSLKIQSVQLAFKKKSIVNNGILFDEKFGAGTDLYMGEENIFIFDCIKKGLNIYSYPVEIAKLDNSESTWFEGYNKKFFVVKGACFYRMSKYFWIFLCLQFLIRKRRLYKTNYSFIEAFKLMIEGVNNIKE